MTELEKEIFWKLLIDLFMERPMIEKRLKEKQHSMSSGTATQTPHDRSEDFSKNARIVAISTENEGRFP